MDIIKTSINDADLIAHIISESNKAVAQAFSITHENNPKHPSFYTEEWVIKDFDRGEEYFIYKKDQQIVGCVAFDNPKPGVAYLNRLSVLPLCQDQGIGDELVRFIIDYANRKSLARVSIGIIADHSVLKNWYLKRGFIAGEVKQFDHLPFNVCYMNYFL